MPSQSTHDALARHWEMLRLLPTRLPGITAAALTDRLSQAGWVVSKRTVERDLQRLSVQFPLACNDRGQPWGWYWKSNANFDVPGIEAADALLLRLIEAQLKPLLPTSMAAPLASRFEAAAAKLAAVSHENRLARWSELVCALPDGLPMKAPVVAPKVLDAVRDALLEGRVLQVRHARPRLDALGPDTGPATKDYELHPLALVQRGAVTYLLATHGDATDPRLYALQRMRMATITEQPARRPRGFSLKAWLKAGGGQFSVGPARIEQVVLALTDSLARALAETPLSDDMRLSPLPDGRWRLEARLPLTWTLERWLLGQGADVEVLAPAELRQQVRERLDAAQARYATSSGKATGTA